MKKNTTRLLTFFLFLSVLILIISGIFYYIFMHHYLLQVHTEIGAETTASLQNPYEGWYHIKGYMLSEEEVFTKENIMADTDDEDTRLVLLEINLKNYKDTALSDKALDDIATILDGIEENQKQIILRFLYDWDGKAKQSEPSSIEQIMSHMDQVATVVNEHVDSIYIMQGIFVGDCGEMHDSIYMDNDSMTTLAKHLAEVIDPSIFLSVRTPQHYRIINETYDTLTASDAFQGTLASRMGLFNDGMMGSVYDLGTYGDGTFDPNSTDYTIKGNREQELQFQNALCTYVPNGGEAILDNSYNDFENAIVDLNTMHVSYLNIDYDAAVMDKWRQSTYTGDDIWNGSNGLDYISSHLGYRFVIQDWDIDSSRGSFSRTADLTIAIQNNGFSNAYRPMDLTCTLVDTETGDVTEIPVDTDPRFFPAGETTEVSVTLPLNEIGEGTYDVYLSLYDPATDEEILFANENNQSAYGCSMGSLSIASGFTFEK